MNMKHVVRAIGLAAIFAVGQAAAAPTCTTTTVLAGGIGNVTDAYLMTAGNCVQAGDKLYGNFILNLPAGGSVDFNLVTIGGFDHHQISFNNAYQVGGIYTIDYEVMVTSTLFISELDGDFTQSRLVGLSNLTKQSSPLGIPLAGIDMTKLGATLLPGSVVDILYAAGVNDLKISEKLTVGGAVSSITDTVVETGTTKVPEPGSLALLGIGLAGLAFVRRRNQT